MHKLYNMYLILENDLIELMNGKNAEKQFIIIIIKKELLILIIIKHFFLSQ